MLQIYASKIAMQAVKKHVFKTKKSCKKICLFKKNNTQKKLIEKRKL